MGKVSETAVNNYAAVENGNLFYSSETSNPADSVIASGNNSNNPTAFLEKTGFDAGKYHQLSLNFKYANASTKAKAAKVSAASSPSELLKNPRVRALLDTIAFAEGTRGNGDYKRVVYGTVIGPANPNLPFDRSLVGKRNVLVSDLRRHPNLMVQVAPGLRSSAAGRYQFLNTTWRGLGMKDFSPRSQDLAAIKLMQRRGMIAPLLRGDFNAAIHKGAPEWASLPTASGNSYYGQGAKSLSSLRSVYAKALKFHQKNSPNSPTLPTAPTAPKTLKRGNRGHAVEVLQDRLIKLGTMTKAQKATGPGIFGPRTERALKTFQRFVGIKPNGQYGASTRAAMERIFDGKIKRGAENRIVRQIQSKLIQLKFMTRAQVNTGPGIFGPRTENAIRKFQAKHDLKVTGIVDAKTFSAILRAKPPRSQPAPNGNAPTYKRWNVYSTGDRAARLVDGYEDLQAHHGPSATTTTYVMRGLTLNHPLQKRDIVLTRPGQSNFGQAVPSPIQGKVLYAGNENDGYGNKVVIKNFKTGEVVLIGHLNSFSVKRGQNVVYGQKLGGQGSTGNSTGAHIHINADPSVIKRWVADLADGKFDGIRKRFDIGRRP